MRKLFPALLLLFPSGVRAQIAVDRPVELTGGAGNAQVKGLADPASGPEALNARAAQAGAHLFAVASGTNTWAITLDPPPDPPSTGTRIFVQAASDNTGPVTLVLNGAGPWNVVKNGTQPLDPGDVAAGETAMLIFDGTAFQLTGARRMQRRPCPGGFTQVNELYCIEQVQHDTMTWLDAASTCGSMDARLCTWGEWYAACQQATALGLQNMTGDWEWTNNSAAADHSVRVVGQFSCPHAGTTNGFDFARNFRCCFKR